MLYTAVIPLPREQPHGVPTWTAPERNVRVPVTLAPQRVPDPPAQGAEAPSRRAMIQVVTFFNDMCLSQEERFTPIDVNWSRMAWRPYGRRTTPWTERANIAPPQHVAYGSLF
jgi:hypothetical protein